MTFYSYSYSSYSCNIHHMYRSIYSSIMFHDIRVRALHNLSFGWMPPALVDRPTCLGKLGSNAEGWNQKLNPRCSVANFCG